MASKPKVQQQKVEYVQPEQQAPTPPPEPKEYPDTLRSVSYARLLDLICEGPIEGLVDRNGNRLEAGEEGAELGRGIFIDETPLRQGNGRANFKGIRCGITHGSQDQDPISGFSRASQVIFSGEQITASSPVTIAVTNTEAEKAIVAVRVGSMLTQNKTTGDITGSEVHFTIYASRNGGSYEAIGGNNTIKGKTTSPYVKYIGFDLPQGETPGENTWTIRVVRTTPDASTLNVQNDTYLDFVTILTRNRYRYPNSVLIGTEINAEGFSSIPQRSYHIRGLLIQVPSNYFPETREYNRDSETGDPVLDEGEPVEQPWDGTFYTTWSDNPAWCFYDLATNTRYGLGDYLTEGATDKWSLYTIARYCDEFVDDGRGSTEPRFTCNLVLNSREQAWKVMQDMASIFRGMIYWQQGGITAVQDSPKEAIASFTNANVIGGTFNYSGTAKKARHTSALVRWNDPDDFFRPKYEIVEDLPGIIRYGYRKIEVAAFGCSSRGQAHRLGRWVLITDLYETDTVSFKAGLEAAYLRPGDVFQVLDNDRAGNIQAGRVATISSDRQTIGLDRAIDITTAGAMTVAVTRPAGFLTSDEISNSTQTPLLRTSQAQTITVTNAQLPAGAGATVTKGSRNAQGPTGPLWANVAPGDYLMAQGRKAEIASVIDTGSEAKITLREPWIGATQEGADFVVLAGSLTLDEALDDECQPGAVFILSKTEVEPQQFRTINVKESEPNIYEIVALQYQPNKYASIDEDIELEAPPISDVPEDLGDVLPPKNIEAEATTVVTQEGVKRIVAIHWEASEDLSVSRYLVEFRKDDGNWIKIEETTATHSQFAYETAGTFDIRVSSISIFGVHSETIEITLEIENVNPINLVSVEGLELVADGGQANATEFQTPDAKFQWRLINPNSTQEPGQEDAGASEGFVDPYFDHFLVTVHNPETGAELYREVMIAPAFAFTFQKNTETTGGPHASFRIEVRAVDAFNNSSPAATLTVSNPAPPMPTGVYAATAWRVIFLHWTNPTIVDFDGVEILRGTTNDPDDALVIARVWTDAFTLTGEEESATSYFWVRAVDTFGNRSQVAPSGGAVATTGTIPGTDVRDFTLSITKLFSNTIALDGDIWGDNDPVAGSISWNEHSVVFRGVKYTIEAGDTALQYVWWKGPVTDGTGETVTPGETTYRTSDTHPADLDPPMAANDFIIATNADNQGVHDLAWRAMANALIGSAFIKTAAIRDAHISELSADKIKAGTISGEVVQIGGVAGSIQSTNFVDGVSGWRITGTGAAQFNDLITRDSLNPNIRYANPDFPTRGLVLRPTRTLVIPETVDCNYNGSPDSAFDNTFKVWNGASFTTNTREIDVIYHLTGDGSGPQRPHRKSLLFFGTDTTDFVDPDGGSALWNIDAENRRLAFDGWNTFEILGHLTADTHYTVWFQINDVIHNGSASSRTGTMGNLGVTGIPWYHALTAENSGGAYEQLPIHGRIKIYVPAGKYILFGIAPIDHLAERPADGNDQLRTGWIQIAAENATWTDDTEATTIVGPFDP